MLKQQRIVITGGGGFIGSFLTEKLVRRGFKNIVVMDKNPRPQIGVHYVKCDVFTDQAILREQIRARDVIIHLACSTTPGLSETNYVKDAEENIVGTLKLLEICKNKKIKKFIFASSGGTIYGNRYGACKESDEIHPINFYGTIKLVIEEYLYVHKHLYDIPYVIARISNPYCRKTLDRKKLGAIDTFLHQAIKGKPIFIWGDGENVRDYVHIDDVTDFFLLAIEKKSLQGIYNVGTGKGTTLNQILSLIGDILGYDLKPKYKPAREVDVRFNVLNIQKVKKEGWQPKYTLSKGLRVLYQKLNS